MGFLSAEEQWDLDCVAWDDEQPRLSRPCMGKGHYLCKSCMSWVDIHSRPHEMPAQSRFEESDLEYRQRLNLIAWGG